MRVLIERIRDGVLKIENKKELKIKFGLLLFTGICKNDTDEEITWAANKILNLRIFEDNSGKMNLSILDVKGDILVVSNFTLCADITKGNRPSFDNSEDKDKAKEKFDFFVKKLKESNLNVIEGEFGAYMEVHHVNVGPVNILLDTKEKFKKRS
ncbi:MAG: D-aminoacyl-tRNA deacylase [Candidatus Hydrothermales bacterium]